MPFRLAAWTDGRTYAEEEQEGLAGRPHRKEILAGWLQYTIFSREKEGSAEKRGRLEDIARTFGRRKNLIIMRVREKVQEKN